MAMHFVMDEHVPVPNGRCPRVRARLVVAGSPAASRAAALWPGMRAVYLEWDMSCVRALCHSWPRAAPSM